MFGRRKGRRLYFLRVFNEAEIPGWWAGDKRSHWSGNSGVVQGCKPKCLLWGEWWWKEGSVDLALILRTPSGCQ